MTFFESSSRSNFFLEHDLFRPAFARRSVAPNDGPCGGLRAGGKPVPTFRDHAPTRAMRITSIVAGCAALMLWSSSAWAQGSGAAARERLAVRICAADISARCHGVEGGQGGLRACVKEHLKDLSEPCRARLA